MRLITPSVVVLVGASSSGKSTWAAANFNANEIVSSDDLRAVAGIDADDQRAGADAFFLLDEIVRRRVARKLTTVIDTTGLDADRRLGAIALARAAGLPVYAVGFDTPSAVCRRRNSSRDRSVPRSVLDRQLAAWRRTAPVLEAEGFDGVMVIVPESGDDPIIAVPSVMVDAPKEALRQRRDPARLAFGLQISSYTDDPRSDLVAVAAAAEDAGFDAIWVMDHLRQIPQVGREWDPMLDALTVLAHLSASTDRVTLGALVSPVSHRNPVLLGKAIASLDVLSGGRAVCGLGLGWFAREAEAYGLRFPDVATRYALLEDALELLPLLWGPGSPSFEGRLLSVPEAMCYPRPAQEHIPILLGGSGERRTLRLAARHADMCNLFGDPATVANKVEVLAGHCARVDRDPREMMVTHLGPVLVAMDRRALEDEIERLRPRTTSAAAYAVRTNAGILEDHVGRFRRLADAGVEQAIVTPAGGATVESVLAMGEVIAAFR